jgi:hypothetical protein
LPASIADIVKNLSDELDRTENDKKDSRIIIELYADRVGILITEERGNARKVAQLSKRKNMKNRPIVLGDKF